MKLRMIFLTALIMFSSTAALAEIELPSSITGTTNAVSGATGAISGAGNTISSGFNTGIQGAKGIPVSIGNFFNGGGGSLSGTQATSYDLSSSYLSYIFGLVDGVLAGTGTQIVGKMFTVFNASVLTLGGIILMYILMTSVLNTAHEGEFLGKKAGSSIWVPLRSALGISLLVPKASGYSAIQIFMMWVIIQGVNAANLIWGSALDYLNTGGIIIGQGGSFAAQQNPAVMKTAGDIFNSMVCMYALQGELAKRQTIGPSQGTPDLFATLNFPAAAGTSLNVPIPGNVPNFSGLQGVCGTLNVYSQLPAGSALAMSKEAAIQSMMTNMAFPAYQASQTYALSLNKNVDFTTILPPNLLFDVTQIYIANTASAINAAQGQVAQQLQNSIQQMKSEGWIMAGSYYWLISSLSGGQTIDTSPPQMSGNVNLPGGDGTPLKTTERDYINGLLQQTTFTQYITNAKAYTPAGATAGTVNGPACSSSDPLGLGMNGLGDFICTLYNFASDQSTGFNPIVRIANLGASLVNISTLVIIALATIIPGLAFGAGAAWGFTFSTAFTALGAIIGPFITVLVSAVAVPGAIMAYYVPLIPYLVFTFSVIGWFVAVIESMVGAPLVALGLIHPEGHDVLGQASGAIMLIANLFLRPSLMIFGFVMGIVLSYVALWMVHRGLGPAFAGLMNAQGSNYGFFAKVISGIAIIFIYAALAMKVITMCFALIWQVPDRIMTWIGGQSMQYGGQEGLQDVQGAVGGMAQTGARVSEGTANARDVAFDRGAKWKKQRTEKNEPKP